MFLLSFTYLLACLVTQTRHAMMSIPAAPLQVETFYSLPPKQLRTLRSHLRWAPPSLVEFNFPKGSQKTHIWCQSPTLRVLREKAWPLLPVASSSVWCVLCMVNSFGKGGLQEASVKGKAFSYVTTKAPTYITKGFW